MNNITISIELYNDLVRYNAANEKIKDEMNKQIKDYRNTIISMIIEKYGYEIKQIKNFNFNDYNTNVIITSLIKYGLTNINDIIDIIKEAKLRCEKEREESENEI